MNRGTAMPLPARVFCIVAPLAIASVSDAQTSNAQTARPVVIESTTPQWTAATALKVDPKPMITLGDADVVFTNISGAHRYQDGRIVVADSKARELLMFGANGQFLRKIARSGSGPGEFQSFDRLMRAGGDSIAVWDYRTRRMTYFGARGEFVRSSASAKGTPVQSSAVKSIRYPTAIGLFADGTLLVEQRQDKPRENVSKKVADSTTYYAMSDTSKQPIGDFFTKESWDYFHVDGSIIFGDSPFGRAGALAVGPKSFFTSDGIQFEVKEYDKSATPLRVMRIRRAAAPVTADQIAKYKREFNESSKEHNEAVLKWMTYPKTLPAFKHLVRDDEGRIWAGLYDTNPALSRYELFDANGRWLGTTSLPNNSTLIEAGKDWVLLSVLTTDGEPFVQLHRLARAQ